MPEAVHWVPIVKKFKAKVYEGRWGTICYTSVAFRQLHRGARQFWCIERYTSGGQYKPKDAQKLMAADAAIKDDGLWVFWIMLSFLFAPLLQGEIWIDSCDSHWSLLRHDDAGDLWELLPDGRIKLWLKCPARRMRSAALVSGEFLRVIQTSITIASVELLMALPRDLGAEDYRRTHEQFNRGLMHIAFYWMVKLTHLEEVPTILFAMASTDKDVVDRALDKCVGSTHDHPRIVELNSEPLLSQAQEWRALPTVDDLESFPQ